MGVKAQNLYNSKIANDCDHSDFESLNFQIANDREHSDFTDYGSKGFEASNSDFATYGRYGFESYKLQLPITLRLLANVNNLTAQVMVSNPTTRRLLVIVNNLTSRVMDVIDYYKTISL